MATQLREDDYDDDNEAMQPHGSCDFVETIAKPINRP